MDKGNKNSKQLILEAATQVFAEKGFDGARVDEIAKYAQVNKALIYYYFESKDKILEELMAGLIKEMIDLKDKLGMNSNVFLDIKNGINIDQIDYLILETFTFFNKHRLLLNILISEALKGSANNNIFFKMLNLSLEDTVGRIKTMHGEISDYDDFITTAVFFTFMPMLDFTIFGEKWAEYNHFDYAIVQEKYYKAFKKIYTNYFLPIVSHK
jgi:AcrR family transcriptional regulator